MKVLQTPAQWLTQLGELIRPKTEQEKHARATYAMIGIAIAALLLVYKLLT